MMKYLNLIVIALLSSVAISLSSCCNEKNQENMDHLDYMKLAIQEATEGIEAHDGGPFGSIIVKDGKIVGRGHNCVLKLHDASAHGEISAIRDAGKNLGTFDLSGCVIYTTGEPCHMCLCACMWANISKIYYGCTIEDNGLIGFRDDKFDKIFGGRDKLGDYMEELGRKECLDLFDKYNASKHDIY